MYYQLVGLQFYCDIVYCDLDDVGYFVLFVVQQCGQYGLGQYVIVGVVDELKWDDLWFVFRCGYFGGYVGFGGYYQVDFWLVVVWVVVVVSGQVCVDQVGVMRV